jgi:hypothetical protein
MHKPEHAAEDLTTEEAIKRGYEEGNLDIPALLKWAVGLIIFVGASSIFAYLCWVLFTSPNFSPSNAVPRTKIISPSRQEVPAGIPRVQGTPVKDIKEFRQQEEVRLNGYSKDSKDGSLHIPVERAMEILSTQGLAVQAPGTPPTGVKPTPEMKLHPEPAPPLGPPTANPGGGGASNPTPSEPTRSGSDNPAPAVPGPNSTIPATGR